MFFLLLLLLLPLKLCAESSSLLSDLEEAARYDVLCNKSFPTTYNHLLSTGYFTTPSARMGLCGEIGAGAARVPPYLLLNGRIQLFSHLEISANYRIFQGIPDPGLSPHGFGDMADRGANFKLAFLTPEDSNLKFPGFAVGIEDFLGTKAFTNYFVVATQVWQSWGLEASLGWGTGRYTGPSKGFFGGFSYFPFWLSSSLPEFFKPLSLSLEYDPIDYANPRKEPHPWGHYGHFPLNAGLKYKLYRFFDLSACWLRGEELAVAASLNYNWGDFEGFLPKINDPLIYTAPIDTEPLGCYRPPEIMVQQLNYALAEQGFLLTQSWMDKTEGKTCLWIRMINSTYRTERIFRYRLENLLAATVPANVDETIVLLSSSGLPCQEYHYSNSLLAQYRDRAISSSELFTLAPRVEVVPQPKSARSLFYRPLDYWRFRLAPRFETFFGSSGGKFKYDLGLKAEMDGYLPLDIFYELQVSYTLLSTLQGINDFDFYNPSKLPIVNTDYVRYRQESAYSTDKAYVQKNMNLGSGHFAKVSAGYFQSNYAGLAGEFLYYPADSLFAVGLEGALLKKRRYAGLGFQSKLRRLTDEGIVYQPYTLLSQYFLDFYLDIPQFCIATKASVGQFLARDLGGRLEVTRYFSNGLRITGWLTLTNASDKMHGGNYYDKGIAFELPLDLFYRCTCRKVWNYGLAAWLRDAGATTTVGRPLFDILNRERR